jgi:hypothetical protein
MFKVLTEEQKKKYLVFVTLSDPCQTESILFAALQGLSSLRARYWTIIPEKGKRISQDCCQNRPPCRLATARANERPSLD